MSSPEPPFPQRVFEPSAAEGIATTMVSPINNIREAEEQAARLSEALSRFDNILNEAGLGYPADAHSNAEKAYPEPPADMCLVSVADRLNTLNRVNANRIVELLDRLQGALT